MDMIWAVGSFAFGMIVTWIAFLVKTGRWAKKVDMEIKQKEVDVSELKRDIRELQEKDKKLDVDLTSIKVTLESVQVMTMHMHDFFLDKGMRTKEV